MSGDPAVSTAFMPASQTPEGQAALAAPSVEGLSPGMKGYVDLVLAVVDPKAEATPFELDYFFARAKKLGLDPLARQCYLLPIGGKRDFFVGIHGARDLANRTGERGSERVTERTYEEGSKVPSSVTVSVERVKNGRVSTYFATARADEYRPANPDPRSSWATKPNVMLEKCAAMLAYRMAFPEVLGGTYIPEERDADAEPRRTP